MAPPFIKDQARKRGQISAIDLGEESAAARIQPEGAHLTLLTI
jgi:hypothetical protein